MIKFQDTRAYNFLYAPATPNGVRFYSGGSSAFSASPSTPPVAYAAGSITSMRTGTSWSSIAIQARRNNALLHRSEELDLAEEHHTTPIDIPPWYDEENRKRLLDLIEFRRKVNRVYATKYDALAYGRENRMVKQQHNPVTIFKRQGDVPVTEDDFVITFPSTPTTRYTYKGFFAPWFQPGLPVTWAPVLSESIANAMAVHRAYEKLRGAMEFQGVTFLGELRGTIGTFVAIAKSGLLGVARQRKEWADAKKNFDKWLMKRDSRDFNRVSKYNSRKFRWIRHKGKTSFAYHEAMSRLNAIVKLELSIQFGILGFQRDCIDFLDAMDRIITSHQKTRISAKSPDLDKTTRVASKDRDLMLGLTVDNLLSTTWHGKSKCVLEIDYVPPSLARALGFSSADLVRQLWEMTRLSYVVDWFLGIGNCIEAVLGAFTSPANFVVTSSVTYTETMERTSSMGKARPAWTSGVISGQYGHSTHKVTSKYIHRTVDPSPVLFPLPGPLIMKGVSLAQALAGFSQLGAILGKNTRAFRRY